eukprot:609559_1
MALQPVSGMKRKLSNGDADDDAELVQGNMSNVMNPSKRHTESQRVKNTDIPFEDLGPDEESSDSQYEYTFIDDDEKNEPYIPISEHVIQTKHNQTPMESIKELETKHDEDDDLMMNTKPKESKTTALELNWSDDDCIEAYESDAASHKNDTENGGKVAWFPTQKEDVDPNEEMKYDKSAYNVLFEFHSEWPCLSFDIIRDNLGAVRSTIPYSLYLVSGTQADPMYRNDEASAVYKKKSRVNKRIQNKIQFLKLNDIQKTKYDDDRDDIAEEKDDEYIHMTDDDPVLQNRDIHHPSIVNRIRAKRVHNTQHLVATMSSDCHLYIWNGTEHVLSLDGLSSNLDAVTETAKPICSALHSDEGYGLAWHPMPNETALLTGSCVGELRLYKAKASTFVRTMQFKTLKASIEDIAWSPQHKDIFASVGVDKCIRLWDTRQRAKEHIARIQNAHRKDINVCSWNPHSDHQHLLLTGSDDHSFKIWDLRKHTEYTIPAHDNLISNIQFEPNKGEWMVSASFDKTVRIWSMKKRGSYSFKLAHQMKGHHSRISDLCISDGGEDSKPFIVTASHDKTWKIWTDHEFGDVSEDEQEHRSIKQEHQVMDVD